MQIYLEEFGKTIGFPDDFSEDQIRNAIQSDIVPRLRREREEERQAEIQKKRDEVGIVGAFGRGLSRGITQTRGLVGDVLPAMIGEAIGADEYRTRQMEEYAEKMRKMEEERPSLVPSYQDIDSVSDALKYGLETVGQFVPSVATSITGGGIGGFIGQRVATKAATKALEQYGKKELSEKAKKEVAKKALKTGQKAVLTGQIGGAFAGSGIQTVPEAYATIERETGDPHLGEAVLVGSVNAALDSIVPAAFLARIGRKGREEVSKNILSKLLGGSKTRKGTIAKSALRGGIIEGLTKELRKPTN